MTHVTIETALLEQLVVALEGIEALIEHQYTGTREAMNALQNASDDAQEAIEPLRTALAQQGEQPVCAGCGIPAGDVHMSTCQSGKWPSRVSNGDTAAPAPVAQAPFNESDAAMWLTKNKLTMHETLSAAPQAQEPIAKLFGTLPVYDTPEPQAQDKSDNYLSGYCTGRTDLLKEQSAQPAQGVPEVGFGNMQSAQPVAQPLPDPCHTCAHYQQGKLPGVRIHDETCYECRSYWGNKWEAA